METEKKKKEEEGYFLTEEDEGGLEEQQGRTASVLEEGARFVKAVEGKPYQLKHVVTRGLTRNRSGSNAHKGAHKGANKGAHKGADATSFTAREEHSTRTRRTSTATAGLQKGYFCSEVCAAYLKSIRILPPGEAHCAAYWPSSFDVGGDIETDIRQMGYVMDPVVELNLRILEMAKAKGNSAGKGGGVSEQGGVVAHSTF